MSSVHPRKVIGTTRGCQFGWVEPIREQRRVWHQRGPVAESSHRYVFQLVMTSAHRKMFNECVPHPLVGRGLYDKRETPRIMGIFPLPALSRTLCRDLRKNLKHTTLIQVYVSVFMCCQVKSVVFHDFMQSKPSICVSTQRFILEEAGPLVKTIAMRMR